MSPLWKLVLGTRMGLICVALLLFLPQQGRPQAFGGNSGRQGSLGDPGIRFPDCCTDVSKSLVRGRIVSCYQHNARTFSHCRVHAFILTTKKGRRHCVDPAAEWLESRFQQMQRRNIQCQHLGWGGY